jgi:hypothetical protein
MCSYVTSLEMIKSKLLSTEKIAYTFLSINTWYYSFPLSGEIHEKKVSYNVFSPF